MAKINEIAVDDLFGRYTYSVKSNGGNVLLYGDNGSGKSTILRLAFHLLCTQENAGHKSWVANCPFKSVRISLDDCNVISAYRSSHGSGSYTMSIAGKRKGSYELKSIYQGNEHVIPGSNIDDKYVKFMMILDEITPAIVYMTDERTLLYNDPPHWAEKKLQHIDDHVHNFFRPTFLELIENEKKIDRRVSKDLDEQLLDALRAVNSFFNKVVSQASIEGDSNVNQIYLRILNDIVSTKELVENVDVDQAFGDLSERMTGYVKYGLMPNLDIDSYLRIMKTATGSSKTAVSKAIIPLLDALYERMNALQSARDIISAFHETINGVLLDKVIQYQYGQGIMILTHEQVIDPSKLSSGEKQLIVILCNIISKAHSSPVFFIDEPEISLNIKWQRNFMKMLDATTAHGKCQFFLATHSMDILSQNSDIVTNLNEQRYA